MRYEMVSTSVMRESDAWTIANLVPSKELMLRAGKGIFTEVVTLLHGWKAPVAIVCGKGNNAGDGFVVAKLLSDNGISCKIYLLYPDGFSEDGKYYFDECINAGIEYEIFDEHTELNEYAYIVDCIFGTGIRGEVTGLPAVAINKINDSGAIVVSADINSGLNGDTGLGNLVVISDLTVSIGTYKFGHFRGRAKEVMKRKTNVDIGIVIRGEIVYNDDGIEDI